MAPQRQGPRFWVPRCGLTWRTLIVRGERGQVVFVHEGALEEGRSLVEMERVIRALTGVTDRPRLPG